MKLVAFYYQRKHKNAEFRIKQLSEEKKMLEDIICVCFLVKFERE